MRDLSQYPEPPRGGGYRDGDGLSEEPTGELVKDFFVEGRKMVDDTVKLMRAELDVARQELRSDAKRAARPLAMMSGGGVLIHIAAILLAFTIAWALSFVMPVPVAFLITAALVGGGGAVLIYLGRERLKKESFTPRITLNHLQEEKQWAKETMQSVRSNLRHDT